MQDIANKLYTNLVEKENGCIEWQKATTIGGYGRIRIGQRIELTHRLMWSLHNGPIHVGMCICHKCDNPPCCNIDHLFLGTYQNNNDDTIIKGHHISGNAKLNMNDVKKIKQLLLQNTYTHQQIGNIFGVSKATITNINCRRIWSNVVCE